MGLYFGSSTVSFSRWFARSSEALADFQLERVPQRVEPLARADAGEFAIPGDHAVRGRTHVGELMPVHVDDASDAVPLGDRLLQLDVAQKQPVRVSRQVLHPPQMARCAGGRRLSI